MQVHAISSRRLRVPQLTALALVSAALGAAPAFSQLRLLRIEGAVPGGSAFISAGVGDVDGDGIADLAIGAASDRTNGVYAGRLEIRSGRDGSILRTWLGAPGEGLGASVAGPGDVDRDGVPDIAAGSITANYQGRNKAGTVTVFSGRTGAVLRVWGGTNADDWLGSTLDIVGDLDRDGALDLIAGAPQNGNPVGSYEAGYALLLSPRQNRVLRTLVGSNSGDEFGNAAAGCGDVDMDGIDDVIVGSPLETFRGDRGGCVRVFSGRTGAVLHVFTGRRGSDHYGIGVSGAGDVNGDGYADLLTGGIDMIYANRSGEARLFSGRDGSLIRVIPGVANGSMFGRWVGPAGDFDGDGADDVWVGAPMEMPKGYVRIYSGRTGALLSEIAGNGGGFGAYGRNVGDLDGDGWEELAFGAPMEGGAGVVYVFSLRPTSTFGLGCSTRRQKPELALSVARIGSVCNVDIDARRPRQPVMLLLSPIPDRPLPIDNGCALYVDPAQSFVVANTLTAQRGEVRIPIAVPLDARLVGVELALQALIQDNARLELSNGGLLEVQR
ncbi:MAG: VCBS repeat-containing protein [Planctomycetes bacterium]|nr:VCBS repeat-containing protein [Planctomycetota bacterium]